MIVFHHLNSRLVAIAVFAALMASVAVFAEPLVKPAPAGAACTYPGDSLDSVSEDATSGSTSYTDSLVINIDNASGIYTVGSGCMFRYWYAIVSNGSSPAMSSGSNYGTVRYLGDRGAGFTGDYAPFSFALNGALGDSSQGNHSVRIAVSTCTVGGWSSGGIVSDPWGNLLAHGGSCTNIVSYDQPTIFYDSQTPTASWISPASGTTYRSSTSYTFDWGFSDAAPSSGYAQASLALQRALIASPGVCSSSWSTISTLISTGGAYDASGLTSGYCWRMTAAVQDHAGNSSSTVASGAILVDAIAPIASGWSTPIAAGWSNASSLTFDWDPYIETASGLDHYETKIYRAALSGASCPSASLTQYLSTISTSVSSQAVALFDGYCYQVRVSGVDKAGNVSGSTSSAIISVDRSPPLSGASVSGGTPGLNGWYTTPVSVSLSSVDGGSGLNGGVLKYRLDGGPVITCDFASCGQPDGSLALTVDITGDGTHTLEYWASDAAGNLESVRAVPIAIDTTAPTGCFISSVNDTIETSIEVTIGGCLDAGSGLSGARFGDAIEYQWDATYRLVGWLPYTGGDLTHWISMDSGSGNYLVMAEVRDAAGNRLRFDTTTTLNTAVSYPIMGAGAYVYTCGTTGPISGQPDNTSGSFFVSVDRPLCLVPHLVQRTAGERQFAGEQLTSRLLNPLLAYTLLANPNDPQRGPMSYPDGLVDQSRLSTDMPLQYRFYRETSGMSQALPVLILPFEITGEIGWFDADGNQVGPVEQLTARVELRVVVRNTGRSG